MYKLIQCTSTFKHSSWVLSFQMLFSRTQASQTPLALAAASAQSDQSLRCPHEESLGVELPIKCSDWVDAQADLSLRSAHSHIVGFVTRRLIWMPRYMYEFQYQHQNCLLVIRLNNNYSSGPEKLVSISLWLNIHVHVLVTHGIVKNMAFPILGQLFLMSFQYRTFLQTWVGRAMVLGSFQCRGVLLLWHMVGQGPAVLAAGAVRVGCFFLFSHLIYPIFLF